MKQSLRGGIALAFILAVLVAPVFLWPQAAPVVPRATATLGLVVIFAGLGVFGLVWSVLQIVRGARTRRWTATQGTIIRDGLEEVLAPYSGRSGGRRSWYRAVISYAFVVGDKPWTGHRVEVSDTTDDRYSLRQAQARFERYPNGTSVNVYFDPLEPSQCVLVPGIPWRKGLWGMGVAAGAIALGLWFLVSLKR